MLLGLFRAEGAGPTFLSNSPFVLAELSSTHEPRREGAILSREAADPCPWRICPVCRPPAGMRAWLTTRRTEGTSHLPAQMIIMPVSKETVCDLRQRLAEHSTYSQPLQIPLLHILQGPRLPVRPSYGGNSLTRSELRREAPSGPASTAIGDVAGTRGAELSRPTPHTRGKGLRLPAGTEHSVHVSSDQ